MKVLPGLPKLPVGQWWEVSPSASGEYYVVDLKAPSQVATLDSALGLPRLLGRGRTRSWPRPTVRSIVRVAHAVHRRWLVEEGRKAAPFVGKLVGR